MRMTMNAIAKIMDGMEGVMSECGESEISRYWKADVLPRYDAGSKVPIKFSQARDLLADMIEGLEGYLSCNGPDSRYWKSTALSYAKKALKDANTKLNVK